MIAADVRSGEHAIVAQSALRRVAWLRRELNRDDVRSSPSLRRVYARELARLLASPRLKLHTIKED